VAIEIEGHGRVFMTQPRLFLFDVITLVKPPRCVEMTKRMQTIASIFAAVFIAELGDKTQLATLLFASDRTLNPFQVFFAAALALVFSTGLAVLVGNQAARYLDMVPLKLIAGIGFIAIGCWAIVEHFRGA